jgi:hypothetical protein
MELSSKLTGDREKEMGRAKGSLGQAAAAAAAAAVAVAVAAVAAAI